MTKPCFGLECSLKPYLTVKDKLLVSFAITLNHRQTFLLHSNTLACVKAEI